MAFIKLCVLIYSSAFHLAGGHGILEHSSKCWRGQPRGTEQLTLQLLCSATDGQSLSNYWSSYQMNILDKLLQWKAPDYDRVTESLHLNISF